AAVAPHRLTQAVLNLVHNARDAILATARGSGAITIQARADGDGRHVILRISDDGIGMDEHTKRHCIEPFFTTRGRSADAAAAGSAFVGGSGSGMGMTLAHVMARRAGGRLDIESAPGAGCTVSLTLPVFNEAPVQPS